jgi:hypothetical protein
MFEQIATDLQNKTDELHFLQGALNNLELVKLAQEEQKEWGWSRFTEQAIRDYKTRVELLEKEISKLRTHQEELYNPTV